MLKGEPELDTEIEEHSLFEIGPEDVSPREVTYNPQIPIETFDVIVTDECHRSIYNLWRQVLEYFYKYQTTKQINEIRDDAGTPFWQRSFYDHIIRHHRELDAIRQYIADNPLKWELDRDNPINIHADWRK
jgi:hypothetical protein